MKGKIAFLVLVSLLLFGGCIKNSQEPKLEPAKKAEVSGLANGYKIQLDLGRVVEVDSNDPFIIEDTSYLVKIGCDGDLIRVIWTSEERLFSSCTSEIACSTKWKASW